MQEIGEADIKYSKIKLTKIAFGSCHKNKVALVNASSNNNKGNIWEVISKKIQPQSFLWLGDAIYSPNKKESISPIHVLKNEYDNLIHNATIGYRDFLHHHDNDDTIMTSSSSASSSSSLDTLSSIHGTHDDHDYGGNDYGNQMPNKDERKEIFLDFLKASNEEIIVNRRKKNIDKHEKEEEEEKNRLNSLYHKIRSRDGVYSSIEYGSFPHKVKVILLDTRSGRDNHCPIPSIGAINLPLHLGSPLACVSRWIIAGLNIQRYFEKCQNIKMLSEDQWTWLEQQLSYKNHNDKDDDDDVALYLIGSSIQVLTTNPALESWGHYPEERFRLLQLLNNNVRKGAAVVILSGDVHHGELLDSSTGLRLNGNWNEGDGRIIEVTTSGLTHSCEDPFYGPLCAPILDKFPNHRHETMKNYYTGRNFGSIDVTWGDDSDFVSASVPHLQINVHDDHGEIVLTTGSQPLSFFASQMTNEQLENIIGVFDGHLIPYYLLTVGLVLLVMPIIIFRIKRRDLICTKEKKNS